jgi:hypothetical protein
MLQWSGTVSGVRIRRDWTRPPNAGQWFNVDMYLSSHSRLEARHGVLNHLNLANPVPPIDNPSAAAPG